RRDAAFDLNMIDYNRMECKALSVLVGELNKGFVKNGIRLRKDQYFGPGQVAQHHLHNLRKGQHHHVHNPVRSPPEPQKIDLTNKTIYEKMPRQVRKAAEASFIGAWIENFYHGIYPGKSYGRDINSAYPLVMTTLPCLLHGKWIKGKGDPHDDKRLLGRLFGTGQVARKTVLCLAKATMAGSDPRIGAMLHRDRQGRILRPHKTRGWHWVHEIERAQRASLVDTVEYQHWHAYLPDCDCDPPLASLATLYNDRLDVGKNSP